jgi:hypothetical protein
MTSVNPSDVPDVREELDRKIMETIDTLLNNHAVCKITKLEYIAGLRAVTSIGRGLCDPDLMFACDDEILFAEQSLTAKFVTEVHSSENGNTFILRANLTDHQLTVFHGNGVKRKDYFITDEIDAEEKVMQKFNSLKSKLAGEIC